MSHNSPTWSATDKAKQFVKDHIAIDSLMAPTFMGMNSEEMFEEYHDRSLAAGITVTGMTTSISPADFQETCRVTSQFLRHILPAECYTVVRTVGDIRRTHESGKHGFFFQAQNCECLNNKPDIYMPLLKELGLGTLMLAYNERMRAGDGCFVVPEQQLPVSGYGKTVIDACHKYSVIFDTSHASEPTALSAIEYSQKVAPDKPVIETHTSPAALYDSPPEEKRIRAISDERIKAIAATGGTIGIVMLPWLLIAPEAPETRPEDVVDRIDHIKNLVGIDHAALASDDTYEWTNLWKFTAANLQMFDDGGLTLKALKVSSNQVGEPGKIYAAIVDEMWKRGYSDEDVSKVLSGNLMRVYEQVWG